MTAGAVRAAHTGLPALVLALVLAACSTQAGVPAALSSLRGETRVVDGDGGGLAESCLERLEAGQDVSPLSVASGDGIATVTLRDAHGDLHACDGAMSPNGDVTWCGFAYAPLDGLDHLAQRGGAASFTCQGTEATEVFAWVTPPVGAAWVAVRSGTGWRAFPAAADGPTRVATEGPLEEQPLAAVLRFVGAGGETLGEREQLLYPAG